MVQTFWCCAGCFSGSEETAAKNKPKGVGTLGPVRGCIYLMFPFIVDSSFSACYPFHCFTSSSCIEMSFPYCEVKLNRSISRLVNFWPKRHEHVAPLFCRWLAVSRGRIAVPPQHEISRGFGFRQGNGRSCSTSWSSSFTIHTFNQHAPGLSPGGSIFHLEPGAYLP